MHNRTASVVQEHITQDIFGDYHRREYIYIVHSFEFVEADIGDDVVIRHGSIVHKAVKHYRIDDKISEYILPYTDRIC